MILTYVKGNIDFNVITIKIHVPDQLSFNNC